MADTTFIPSLQLDASVVGSEHCFDAWREAVRAVYSVNPAGEGLQTTESVKAWLLNGLIFSEVSFSAQSFSHDASLAHHSNYLSVQLYKNGGCKGLIGDQSWELSSGDVHIFDFSREFYSAANASSVVGVVIPHESIGYDPARHPVHMVFEGNTPIGQFLSNTLLSLVDQLPSVQKHEADDLAKGFCGLLQGIAIPDIPLDPTEEKNRVERHREMRAYLNRNLSVSDLGVSHLCRIFNISRPSVYRDFTESGGVANYITQRRLERAYHQLTSVPFGQKRIKEVAYGVGFTDPAHFSRLFRQRFGMTPKEASNLVGASHVAGLQKQITGSTLNFGQLSAWLQSI